MVEYFEYARDGGDIRTAMLDLVRDGRQKADSERQDMLGRLRDDRAYLDRVKEVIDCEDDPTSTLDYLRWICPDDGLINVFCKFADGTTDGRVLDGIEEAARAVDKMKEAGASAIWASIHNLADDTPYQVRKVSRKHVTAYRFLAIDLDNVPATAGACATDDERRRVSDVASRVLRELMDEGLSIPLTMATGNGYCLLFPISLPCNEQSHELMSDLAAALSSRYSTEHVELDEAVVQDESRILGVVGTDNRNKRELPIDGRVAQVRRIVGAIPPYRPMAAEQFQDWARSYIERYGVERTQPEKATVDIFENVDSRSEPSSKSDAQQVLERVARAYLDRCEPAIEGQHGDAHTFSVAGNLLSFEIEGTGERLNPDDVHRLMAENWNNTCSPPWADTELMSKVQSAATNGTPRPTKPISLRRSLDDRDIKSWLDGTQLDIDDFDSADGDSDLIMADTVTMRRIEWLWDQRFPLGNISMIYGDGGCGKSQLTSYMAAIISKGGVWCNGSPSPQGSTIIISGEDNMADTLVPRLAAAGADLKRVGFLPMITKYDEQGRPYRKTFSLSDLSVLEGKLARLPDIKLVVIDPIGAYMDGRDTHRDSDVRSLLTPLKELAERNGIAVVMVAHTNKSRGTKAIDKVMGSKAFTNAVRAAYYVAENPQTGEGYVMIHSKRNIATQQPALAYNIVAEDVADDSETFSTSKVEWLGEVDVTESEAIQSAEQPAGAVEEAVDFLTDLLGDGRSKLARDIFGEAKRQGISQATIYRAKRRLNIESSRDGFGGSVVWRIEGSDSEADDDGDDIAWDWT